MTAALLLHVTHAFRLRQLPVLSKSASTTRIACRARSALFSSTGTVNSLPESARTLVSRQNQTLLDPKVTVLSENPLIYVVSNLLSVDECKAYQDYVNSIDRPMTRSNPPEVSLEARKLWPLSILSLLAGMVPASRTLQRNDFGDDAVLAVLQTALPNIAMAFAFSLFLAYMVVLPLVRFQAHQSARTSVAVALNQKDDMEFVQELVSRVSSFSNHSWDNWEAPVVTKYDPGAVFARHGDASPTEGSEWIQQGGQRLVTCICYLNDVASGGETYFHELKLGVRPECGKALIFFPADSDTSVADDRTIHESLPPGEVKWIVQLFGRTKRVPPPLGLPDEFANLLSRQ